VRSLVRALGLSDRVRFLGEVTPADVAALMRNSAVLVVPSRRETFSLVTAEALASGTPVVATRCGGPEEILTDDYGQLTDVDDPAALAIAIGSVLTRTFDLAQLRQYAVERFGTAAAAERLGRLYEQVIGLAESSAVTSPNRPVISEPNAVRSHAHSAPARGIA
jgi:glycosyltransferase involved in cell wall biosynthesis